ncbi:chromosome segregation protein SMC [Acrocarpospora phusangensis]|uniref:Chromosome segregation protein SMC n=1 Tax=Acrocarpospora phusangensis TaxID=1070424 RepID=A0A919QJX3_9ACTN|nr:AAA family ATPase [Acrocarpospora phusangensis]GIH29038.1 chromosome segregation protein SMC [Acrocarpospora phusangensis]
MARRLSEISIEGFTSIQSATVELGSLNVLVGANGAGKSNFVRALELLGYLADGELGLFVGLSGGSSALLHDEPGSTARIVLGLRDGPNFYTAVLRPGARDDLIFDRELVGDEGFLGPLGRGHRESLLDEQTGNDRQSRIARHIAEIMDGCRVYHFHDTSRTAPVKRNAFISDSEALHADAANLAPFLRRMRESHPAHYRRVISSVKQVAPFFREFVLEPEAASDRISLRWRQETSETVFPANAFSDGTLRFICLSALLLQPELPALVILDEPELGLHPFAIVQLAEMLRNASKKSQVLIATQSVTLMNCFSVGDLIVVERAEGASVFRRPDPERLEAWLDDYGLGELWEKNLLGGRPGPERL